MNIYTDIELKFTKLPFFNVNNNFVTIKNSMVSYCLENIFLTNRWWDNSASFKIIGLILIWLMLRIQKKSKYTIVPFVCIIAAPM